MKPVYSILNDDFYAHEMARAIFYISALTKARDFEITFELGDNKFVINPKNIDEIYVGVNTNE